MNRTIRYEVDNRSAGEMYEYLEARIEALKGRIAELEFENESLRMYQGGVEFAETREQSAASNAAAKGLLN